MLFIKISTLRNVPETHKIMKDLEKALYEYDDKGKKLLPKNTVNCIWQTTDCMVHKTEAHYEFDKNTTEIPIFAELYVNTWFHQEKVAKIMEIIAEMLSKGAQTNRNAVFIHTHVGDPGYVFINGKVWTDARDP